MQVASSPGARLSFKPSVYPGAWNKAMDLAEAAVRREDALSFLPAWMVVTSQCVWRNQCHTIPMNLVLLRGGLFRITKHEFFLNVASGQ